MNGRNKTLKLSANGTSIFAVAVFVRYLDRASTCTLCYANHANIRHSLNKIGETD